MSQTSDVLRQILENIRAKHQVGQKTLAVFDLDSTLFDVSPRLERILLDFAAIRWNQKRFPQQVPLLKNIKALHTDWGIQNALVRAGLDGHHPEFQAAIHDYWKKSFFSNHYLQFDVPTEGAVEYVQAVYKAGADIVYLTGRDVARMGEGSLHVLKQWDFPVEKSRAELVLKPDKKMDDALFKLDWFKEALQKDYQKIYFFENEPVNIVPMVEQKTPVEIIFLDTTHAGKAEPPTHIPAIMNFLCNLAE